MATQEWVCDIDNFDGKNGGKAKGVNEKSLKEKMHPEVSDVWSVGAWFCDPVIDDLPLVLRLRIFWWIHAFHQNWQDGQNRKPKETKETGIGMYYNRPYFKTFYLHSGC